MKRTTVTLQIPSTAMRSGVIPAAQHRTSAGRMRHRNDRRTKDARRLREQTAGWS